MRHELKTWPEFYQAIAARTKRVEVRRNDRDFQVGDLLALHEFNPETGQYTGHRCERRVSHMLAGGQFGIEDGYVVMSLADTIICRCGKALPDSCGFHPDGEECSCIGTMCDHCLAEALGHNLP